MEVLTLNEITRMKSCKGYEITLIFDKKAEEYKKVDEQIRILGLLVGGFEYIIDEDKEKDLIYLKIKATK